MLTAKVGTEKSEERDSLVMSRDEARATFDAAARRYLQMSGAEFVQKWNTGFFEGKREMASKIDAVSILLPLVER
jgi:hypothetical protein